MHDPEKSNSGIVAAKPTNIAGQLAEEPAEPRPGTTGNADQQSTHRTQSRVRVTQALERVREAATLLAHPLDHIAVPDRGAFEVQSEAAEIALEAKIGHDCRDDAGLREAAVFAPAFRNHRHRWSPSTMWPLPQAGQTKPSGQRRLNMKDAQLASSENDFWNCASERAAAIERRPGDRATPVNSRHYM